MNLSPSLIIAPLSPVVNLYDGGLWIAQGTLASNGGMTFPWGPYRLEDHYELDRLLVRAGKTWDNTLNSDSIWWRHASYYVVVYLNSNYWSSDTQVIVILDVETASGPQDIQVFVGTDLVREETIDGRENIVIMYDFVPTVGVVVRPKTRYEKLYFYKASVHIV